MCVLFMFFLFPSPVQFRYIPLIFQGWRAWNCCLGPWKWEIFLNSMLTLFSCSQLRIRLLSLCKRATNTATVSDEFNCLPIYVARARTRSVCGRVESCVSVPVTVKIRQSVRACLRGLLPDRGIDLSCALHFQKLMFANVLTRAWIQKSLFFAFFSCIFACLFAPDITPFVVKWSVWMGKRPVIQKERVQNRQNQTANKRVKAATANYAFASKCGEKSSARSRLGVDFCEDKLASPATACRIVGPVQNFRLHNMEIKIKFNDKNKK